MNSCHIFISTTANILQFLRRPPYFNQEWRLDQVLKKKAQEGVKIYIIVYKEV